RDRGDLAVADRGGASQGKRGHGAHRQPVQREPGPGLPGWPGQLSGLRTGTPVRAAPMKLLEVTNHYAQSFMGRSGVKGRPRNLRGAWRATGSGKRWRKGWRGLRD